MSTKPLKKTVKAWALIQSDGYIPPAFNHAHNVFQPSVYTTKEGAQKVSDYVETGADRLKVVECEIIYSLPLQPKKKMK